MQVDAGPLTSGVMGLYFVFLCWSAIMSEPMSEKCNTRPRQGGSGGWLDILVQYECAPRCPQETANKCAVPPFSTLEWIWDSEMLKLSSGSIATVAESLRFVSLTVCRLYGPLPDGVSMTPSASLGLCLKTVVDALKASAASSCLLHASHVFLYPALPHASTTAQNHE